MIDKYKKHPTSNDHKARFTLEHNTKGSDPITDPALFVDIPGYHYII
jgi:hypothetical protein